MSKEPLSAGCYDPGQIAAVASNLLGRVTADAHEALALAVELLSAAEDLVESSREDIALRVQFMELEEKERGKQS